VRGQDLRPRRPAGARFAIVSGCDHLPAMPRKPLSVPPAAAKSFVKAADRCAPAVPRDAGIRHDQGLNLGGLRGQLSHAYLPGSGNGEVPIELQQVSLIQCHWLGERQHGLDGLWTAYWNLGCDPDAAARCSVSHPKLRLRRLRRNQGSQPEMSSTPWDEYRRRPCHCRFTRVVGVPSLVVLELMELFL
jgi:hypothetical protein